MMSMLRAIFSWFRPSRRESPPTSTLDDNLNHQTQLVELILNGLESRKLTKHNAMVDPGRALEFIHSPMFEDMKGWMVHRVEGMKTKLITAKGQEIVELQIRIQEAWALIVYLVEQANIAMAKTKESDEPDKADEEQLEFNYKEI